MAFTGKIFDNTSSGRKFKKIRDDGLEKCSQLNHKMGDSYKRTNNEKENNLKWSCEDCGHSLILNFKKAKVFGGALLHECPKRQWL